jgi:dolichol-phosphate mannosyltransferase
VKLSVVIPARNEALNIAGLVREIDAALQAFAPFEIIVVDDGSSDGTGAAAKILPHVRVLRHPVSAGQSAAVHSGVLAAKAEVICTLDGDGQNPPSNLPALVAPLFADASVGLVAGQRVGRQDTFSKRYASKAANAIRGRMLNDGTRDTGCGLKAFRRTAFLRLPFFNHMHRYLPALFKRDGWKIAHVDVTHRARGAGQSNYTNLQRALVGVVDLFGVAWLLRRAKKTEPESFDV